MKKIQIKKENYIYKFDQADFTGLLPLEKTTFIAAILDEDSSTQGVAQNLKRLAATRIGSGIGKAHLCHDPAGAPYLEASGADLKGYHLSLTDERCASAGVLLYHPEENFCGIGIDLVCSSDFTNTMTGLWHYLFYPQELQIIAKFPKDMQPNIRALLYSFKEAAIKSIADPLRCEIRKNEQAYDHIDLRQFCVTELRVSEDRNHGFATLTPVGNARQLFEQKGFDSIKGTYFEIDSFVMSVTFLSCVEAA